MNTYGKVLLFKKVFIIEYFQQYFRSLKLNYISKELINVPFNYIH